MNITILVRLGSRTDLVVKDDEAKYIHFFKLKCKSRKATVSGFQDDCNDDYDKLQENHKTSKFAKARAYGVGFCTNQQEMNPNWNHRGHGLVKFFCRTWG